MFPKHALYQLSYIPLKIACRKGLEPYPSTDLPIAPQVTLRHFVVDGPVPPFCGLTFFESKDVLSLDP